MSAPTKLTSERHVQVACSMPQYLREVLRQWDGVDFEILHPPADDYADKQKTTAR